MPTVLTSREEGALLLVRLRVDSRHLEEVLNSLAELPFPVNPDLEHVGLDSYVAFPAYEHRLADVHAALAPYDLSVVAVPMLDAIGG